MYLLKRFEVINVSNKETNLSWHIFVIHKFSYFNKLDQYMLLQDSIKNSFVSSRSLG